MLAGERRNGYRFPWPDRCNRCDRQCERQKTQNVAICSYGVGYTWFEPEILVFGFLVKTAAPSSALKKMLRNNAGNLVMIGEIGRAREIHRATALSFEREIETRKNEALAEYIRERRYESDFLENLRPEIQRSFSFLHDYRQFIARVRQNINVVIEARYAGGEFVEKLGRALPAEAAIYWASILMEEKLNIAYLLLNPGRITDASEVKLFRVHGAVLKYLRIYNAAFKEKNVTARVSGESVGEIKGNPTAIPVIPHTLIDNALKYSKRGSEVRIDFNETPTDIRLSVISYGPKIDEDEQDKIFDVFYRGRKAWEQEEEGAGFGLYLAQFIAVNSGTRINVQQDKDPTPFGYKTVFSVQFRRER